MHPPWFFALFWFLFFYILEMELGAMHTLRKCPTLTHISSPISCTANHPDVTHSAKYTRNAVQMTIRLDWVGNRDKGKSTCIQMGLLHMISSAVY